MSSFEANSQNHQHSGPRCPMAGSHGFCPPQPGDSRSPCPALNTMANHGYINRDGRNLSAWSIHTGLKACYGLSTPLALFLSYVGFAILRRIRPLDLYEIGKHNAIEHNASLVHHDTPKGDEFAPIGIDHNLVDKLIDDISPGGSGVDSKGGSSEPLMNALDVARARIRRQRDCGPVDDVHQEIARGEMAIILGVWETATKDKVGVPAEWMRRWIGHEKLPDGWKPTHKQGLWNTMQRSKAIREAMEKMERDDANSNSDATVVSNSLDGKTSATASKRNALEKL